MNENIKFSIAIPTYKDLYLGEAIESVLNQSYQNYEIIVVNDASPYNISSIVSRYDDNRLLYFTNEHNCGAKNVVNNWNNCLSKSNGDYILCMGDDDRLKPNCLHDLALLISSYPDVDIFHARTELIDDNSNYIETLEERPEWESIFSFLYSFNDSGLGSYLYKVSTLKEIGGFYFLPYGWSSDFITAFMAADKHGIVNTKNPGFQYRCNGHSISHDIKSIEDKIAANLHACEWVKNFVNAKNPIDKKDIYLKKIIPYSINKLIHKKNEDLIEYDIRKDFLNRAYF